MRRSVSLALLESKPGLLKKEPGLLPAGIALNVNYPTLAPEDVEGVKLTVQGQASSASLEFTEIAPGLFIPSVGPGDGGEDVKRSDTEAARPPGSVGATTPPAPGAACPPAIRRIDVQYERHRRRWPR